MPMTKITNNGCVLPDSNQDQSCRMSKSTICHAYGVHQDYHHPHRMIVTCRSLP
ncbi:hypothetical protein HanRHA438_Chr03g0102331 [Helianthus annuus]|nr:hypothetical protein HanIR_Chr12g0615541 [Helianthus annuus]KAJ0933986.1 hypothetical protein HanRHA438_Chr03g0102331 [Helianthus annuus]